MHKSVGAIIRDSEGRILMIDRKKPPFGWACPAGHIEEDEKTEVALAREVEEEIGLKIEKSKLKISEFVAWNECSRGTKGHHWFVFEILEYSGRIDKEDKEVKKWEWVSQEDLKKLELEPVWEYWFKKLKII